MLFDILTFASFDNQFKGGIPFLVFRKMGTAAMSFILKRTIPDLVHPKNRVTSSRDVTSLTLNEIEVMFVMLVI